MIIVDQGKVVEFCAETGEVLYDTYTEPRLLYGDLGENIKNTFSTIGKRFTFGGDTGKDQRIYFFNTKEIMGNKYGTANPVLFYTNVCGNVKEEYTRDRIDSQLRTEFMTALQPAFAQISEMGIRYSAVPAHTMEVADARNKVLSEKWGQLRGIKIISFGVNTIKASEKDEQMIKDLQKAAVLRNPNMAAAILTEAQAEAMKSAASNTSTGPMMAFAGMNILRRREILWHTYILQDTVKPFGTWKTKSAVRQISH